MDEPLIFFMGLISIFGIISVGSSQGLDNADDDIIISIEFDDDTDNLILELDFSQLVDMKTTFWHFPRKSQTLISINNDNIRDIFKKGPVQIVFLIHDWNEDKDSDFNKVISKAVLSRLSKRTEIIIVDWKQAASGSYATAEEHVKSAGDDLADFVSTIRGKKKPPLITFIGFGLGAHVAGFAGKSLKKQNRIVSKIFALDPSGGTFEGAPCSERLCKSDAKYLRVLHTNGDGWGMRESIGHADFYPNNGIYQPGCKTFRDDKDTCSHTRSWLYFEEALINKKSFKSVNCPDYDVFTDNLRTFTTRTNLGDINSVKEGNFCFTTAASSPYSL